MMSDPIGPVRAHLARLLHWEESHVSFDRAVAGLPVEQRGGQAAGFDHSPWQLLEHMRLGQHDLLGFCVNPAYTHELAWPDDYWPASPVPPSAVAWDDSIARFTADREKLEQLVRNAELDLTAAVPTGTPQQTYLRAILLVADHNAYHIGQLVAVRRALGVWP